MAKTSIKNIASAIYESSKDKDEKDLNVIIERIVILLDKKRMLGETDKILSALEKIIDDKNKIIRVRLTSCRKTSEKLKEEVDKFIRKKYEAKEIKLTTIENSKLLGGIKLEIGDEVLDATLLNKVHKLQTYLIEN